MIRGLYTSVSALQAAELRQQALASSLANVNTPGYKSDDVSNESFSSLLAQLTDPTAPGTGTEVSGRRYDLGQGALTQSGAPLDVALDGEGFFVLSGPNGPLYTRAGRFSRDATGQLLSTDGLAVQGTDGNRIVAAGAAVSVRADGTVLSDGAEVGTLRTVTLDPTSLTRAGTTTFTSSAPPATASARIVSGSFENSNVDATSTMSAMMLLLRAFEASRQAVQLQNESLGQTVAQVGSVH